MAQHIGTFSSYLLPNSNFLQFGYLFQLKFPLTKASKDLSLIFLGPPDHPCLGGEFWSVVQFRMDSSSGQGLLTKYDHNIVRAYMKMENRDG